MVIGFEIEFCGIFVRIFLKFSIGIVVLGHSFVSFISKFSCRNLMIHLTV